jgi:hypothetical protein
MAISETVDSGSDPVYRLGELSLLGSYYIVGTRYSWRVASISSALSKSLLTLRCPTEDFVWSTCRIPLPLLRGRNIWAVLDLKSYESQWRFAKPCLATEHSNPCKLYRVRQYPSTWNALQLPLPLRFSPISLLASCSIFGMAICQSEMAAEAITRNFSLPDCRSAFWSRVPFSGQGLL